MLDEPQVQKYIIELCFAVQQNNIDLTKTYVTILNRECNPSLNLENYQTLNDNNPFIVLSDIIYNDAFKYLVYNLENLANKTLWTWNYQMYDLVTNRNTFKITEIVEKFIENENNFSEEINIFGYNKIYLDLMKLCFSIHDTILLNKLQQVRREEV